MWFLPLIRRNFILKRLNNSIYYYLERDQGWIEELGSQGVYILFISSSKLLRGSLSIRLTSVVKILILFLIIIIV